MMIGGFSNKIATALCIIAGLVGLVAAVKSLFGSRRRYDPDYARSLTHWGAAFVIMMVITAVFELFFTNLNLGTDTHSVVSYSKVINHQRVVRLKTGKSLVISTAGDHHVLRAATKGHPKGSISASLQMPNKATRFWSGVNNSRFADNPDKDNVPQLTIVRYE